MDFLGFSHCINTFKMLLFLFMPVFTKAFFTFVRSHFMSLSLLSARHNPIN
jgi:hypothetical protein